MAEIVLTQAQNGQSVRAAVGDTIVVQLAENPTTGYRWVARIGPGLSLVGDELVGATATPGAGSERVFRIAARAPGAARIDAALGRSWEPNAPPQAQFGVTIDVQ